MDMTIEAKDKEDGMPIQILNCDIYHLILHSLLYETIGKTDSEDFLQAQGFS